MKAPHTDKARAKAKPGTQAGRKPMAGADPAGWVLPWARLGERLEPPRS
jgi:hypothetical protein